MAQPEPSVALSIDDAGVGLRRGPSRRGRRSFVCGSCGVSQPKWVGCCPGCGAWNTLDEVRQEAPAGPGAPAPAASPITGVGATPLQAVPTGLAEFDRVLGGGLVAGSVTLVGGEPGIGKSTLTLQLAAGAVGGGSSVLMACSEESPVQVGGRAERLGAMHDDIWVTDEASVEGILGLVNQRRPDLLIVDSVQTVHMEGVAGQPGSPSQVRAAAQRLVSAAKGSGTAVVLVGHVTKDSSLAGPKALEHVVDTVTELTGDRHHALRLLRVAKHRFGPTGELGLFEMGGSGLCAVDDPGRLFLADRSSDPAGSVVLPAMEGNRTILVELQALVATATTPHPRRSSQGIDPRRLALLLAVLERRVGLDLARLDVFTTAVGGVQVTEPGADLPLALAVVSAAADEGLGSDVVACGEVGLGGEVRQVAGMERRLSEARRLGFRRAILPESAPEPPPGLEAVRVRTLAEATACLPGGVRHGAAGGLSRGP